MFEPKYQITNKIVSKLSEIAEIKAMVEASKLLPAREAFLRRAAVVKMAHTSTSIEGNRLEEFQVKQLLEGQTVKAEKDQVQEVENYLVGLRRIDELAEKKTFGQAEVLAIHKTVISGLVEPQKAGVWRQGPVYIVNVLPKGDEELAYTPPLSEDVPGLVQNLIDWVQNQPQIHPVIRAGLWHYQFETIHPFADGNGRAGRLLTLLHLYQSGWDFKKVLVLEDYYNRDRKTYYHKLQTGDTYASRQGVDLTDWLEYFVDGFGDEALRVKEQILTLQAVGEQGITRQVLDNDELKMIDFVVTVGRITSSDVVDILRVPKRTAQAKLKRLEDIRALAKQGAGPATYYTIPKID
jgi:Fic family protein